jgi:hypothetical protein
MKPSDESRIREMLAPGEELLWWGRPLANVRQAVVLTIVFLCMTGIAIVAVRSGWSGVIILPLGFMGVVGLVGTISDEIDRRKTCYGLTNRRAIIVKTGNTKPVRSVWLDSLDVLRIGSVRNSKGTILGRTASWDWPHRDEDRNPVTGPLFRYIDSPERVYSLIIDGCPKLAVPPPSEVSLKRDQKIPAWLLKGEKLLWTGRPNPKSDEFLTWSDMLNILLIVPYLFVAGTIVGEALETRDPRREGVGAVSDLTLALIIAGAAAFVSFGVYGGLLHHFADSYRRNTTFYGLTDQRTIVETARSVRFVPLESITSIDVACDEHRRGTISCRSDVIEGLDFWRLSPFLRERTFNGPLFRDILDAEHVRALMADAKAALASRS